MRIGGYAAFACEDDDYDSDGAEIALRRAGFHVMRIPEWLRSRMKIPKDDFLLVTTDGPDDDKFVDAVWDEIQAILDPYGGDFYECGLVEPIELDRPFEELFKPPRPRAH